MHGLSGLLEQQVRAYCRWQHTKSVMHWGWLTPTHLAPSWVRSTTDTMHDSVSEPTTSWAFEHSMAV